MANLTALSGGGPQKEVRWAPIYTGRWSSGIWTNRSPLRDANTTRLTEKFYGPSGDALIAGTNVEITNRLTLARRPGNTKFDTVNNYTNVDNFDEFRLFNTNQEQIIVMIDQTNALYALSGGVKSLVWSKNQGAGQSYMQSVGNTEYFGNGVDNKKWLQSLFVWTPAAQWGTSSTPFLETFLIDPNGNVQQLTGMQLSITAYSIAGNVVTFTVSGTQVVDLTAQLPLNSQINLSGFATATFFNAIQVTVTAVSVHTFSAAFTHANASNTENGIGILQAGGTPISQGTTPAWSITLPTVINNFQGGITLDGSVVWTNRGLPVENWGIKAPTTSPTVTIGSSRVAWAANTYYSFAGVIIDSNGNLQQVTTDGLAGAVQPTWATTVGSVTTDGAVNWTMIQTAASLIWASHREYGPSVATQFSITTNVVTVLIPNNFSNGQTVVPSGFTVGTYLNGAFLLVLSSSSSQFTAAFTHANVGLTADAGTVTPSPYLIGNASGTNCLFKLATIGTGGGGASLSSTVAISLWAVPSGSQGGQFIQSHVAPVAPDSTTTVNSLQFNDTNHGAQPMQNSIINGAGENTGLVGLPSPSSEHYNMAASATLNIPKSGPYTITVIHNNGFYFGFGTNGGNSAAKVSGIFSNPTGQTLTRIGGYTIIGANNNRNGDTDTTDSFVINFPVAGQWPVEIDFAQNDGNQQLQFKINNNVLPIQPSMSGTTQPLWPAWSLASASFNPTTGLATYPHITEAAGQYYWNNLGPTTDYVWAGSNKFSLPDTVIIDPNGNSQAPYRTGYTGTNIPTFQTGIGQVTSDNGTLVWICEGVASAPPPGSQSTLLGGWIYGIALVNTLDDTVSNVGQLTPATGNHIGFNGVSFTPGSGLPPLNQIDLQADYVAIFRTTDGETVPFLIAGTGNSVYTVSLHDYILNGYTDTATDEELNNLISAPINGENTPPAAGAVNLTFYLNRIFFSVGNVVYWTSGPDTPVGNGVNGVAPLNFDTFPSLVKRIVPTAIGALIFTVSDIWLITGNGTANNPIQSGINYAAGVGIGSYNALGINGTLIGFYTTDRQFLVIDPSTGGSYSGFPIGDQMRKDDGGLGTSWQPANVYVTWHANGEDQGWYVSDGALGWYRLMPTPAPETGYTWSPFAQIVGGVKALKSVETSPGVHNLLLGPPSTGPILTRDLDTFTDNGAVYGASAVLGSCVLAQPGQVGVVSFITTDIVNIGTPLSLGVIMDEALPYFHGPFETLKNWDTDPPGLPQSRSLLGQRFYFSELKDEAAVCRHMQVKIEWNDEAVQNELLTFTIFGCYMQEK